MAAEIPDGAVIVARALVNSSLWTMRHEDVRLAILCIVRANWKPKRWYDGEKSITIERGQFVTTRRDLATEARLTEQELRTSMDHLEACGFLTRKSTQTYTVVTLPKYDIYQDLNKYSDKIDPQTNPSLTHTQPNPNPTLTQVQPNPNPKQEGKEGEERDELKEEEDGTESSPKTSVPPPVDLKDLALYVADTMLCEQYEALKVGWAKAYPGINLLAEIRKAHAWEISNPVKRKINRAPFLNRWLGKAQDQVGGQNGTQRKTEQFGFVPKNWTGEGQRQAAEIKRPPGENITR